MAVFEINGKAINSFDAAIDEIRKIWSEHKKEAVAKQHAAALAKGTDVRQTKRPDLPNLEKE